MAEHELAEPITSDAGTVDQQALDEVVRFTSDLIRIDTSNAGDGQPMEPRWNPAGYLRNVVETVRVTAA